MRTELRRIPRPSVPAVFWMACAVGVGIIASSHVSAWLACAAGTAAGSMTPVFRRGGLGLVAVGLSLGLLAGGLAYWRLDTSGRVAARAGYGSLGLEVLSDPARGRFGTSAIARVTTGPAVGARVRLSLPQDATVELGQVVTARASVKPLTADARGAALRRQGLVGTVAARRLGDAEWARSVAGVCGRFRVRAAAVVSRVTGPGGDLLAGVLLGDRRRIAGTDADTDFRTCGLTHLIAVSGGHLAVTAGIVAALLAWAGAPPWACYTGTTTVAALYVVFTGTQPSAVRAAVMAAVAGAALFGRRRADPLAALSWAAVLMMVLWPPSVFDLGFQLSCAAVFGLALFARLATAWLAAASIPRRVSEALALTLVAQAVTMPIATPAFGQFSVIAPIANAVAGPLVELGLGVGLAGLCVLPIPTLSGLVMRVASWPLAAACWSAARLGALPGAAIPASPLLIACCLVVPVALMAVWLAWPQPRPASARVFAVGLVVACTLLVVPMPGRVKSGVWALDVGQGDAILCASSGRTVLVDAGPSGSVLRAAVARSGVRHIDALIVTHMHEDHLGGAEGLKGLVRVDAVYGPAGSGSKLAEIAQACGATTTGELTAGQRLAVGDITLDVLWPQAAVTNAAENRASVVLVAREGAQSALLTGDAESDVLDVLAGKGMLPDVDEVKVGHHGSVGALDDVTLAALKPEDAVISVGAGNKFGHPRPQTLELLAAHGIPVRRTDQSGDVRILPSPAGVRE